MNFINPFTDFGFKKLFGEESSKNVLKSFLNDILPLDSEIVDLSFQPNEKLPKIGDERKAIFDIYCTDEQGQKYIVEMQKTRQEYFKDRSIYYSTFPIQEQAEKGNNWNFKLKAVYCVGILDFTFEDNSNNPDYIHIVKLNNERKEVFYDKLTYVFIELPKFQKTENEVKTDRDKWLYFLRNLESSEDIPKIFQKDDIFEEAFNKASMAKYSKEEKWNYEQSLKVYRDNKNVMDYAIDTAREEGEEKKAKEIYDRMIQSGIPEKQAHKIAYGKAA